MSKRKPLPYHAIGCIDNALMALSEARRQVRPILDESGDLKTVIRAGKALDEINKAVTSLQEVTKLEEPHD